MRDKGNRIDRLRKDIKALRKNYPDVLAAASTAIYDGMGRLAEHEASAIRTHCKEALTGLGTLRKGGAPREVATVQLQLLQNTANRVLRNARESLAILNGTRHELGLQIRRNLDDSRKATTTTTQSATSAKSAAPASAGSRKTTARKRPARKTTTGKTTAASDTPKRTPPKRDGGTRTKASMAKRRSSQKTTSRHSPAADSGTDTASTPASDQERTQPPPTDTSGDENNER